MNKILSGDRPFIDSSRHFIGKGGGDLISFGSGQPDLPPPKEVYDILPAYRAFKYGLIQGQENLREALTKTYPAAKAENFVITNGASEALDLVLRVLKIKAGAGVSKVALPRPYYYSYPFNVKYAGHEMVTYDLVDGKIDIDNFKKTVKGCIAVVINSPSNPTGTVQEVPVLKEIEAFTQREGITVISDEVYKDLIYTRSNYIIQGEHVVTVNTFSKTFAMCGFRVGYLWSPDAWIVEQCVEMKTHTSMNTNILGQEMAFAATQAPRDVVDAQIEVWTQRRDIIYQKLVDLGMHLWKPEGAFYVLPWIGDSTKAVNDLYYDYQMITYDGAWFGAPGRIRLSYALDLDKIETGMERLSQYLKKIGFKPGSRPADPRS